MTRQIRFDSFNSTVNFIQDLKRDCYVQWHMAEKGGDTETAKRLKDLYAKGVKAEFQSVRTVLKSYGND